MAKEFWTIDCETDPFKFGRIPQPFIWGAFNGSEFYSFNTTKELYEFIKDQDAIFYAHNGGKFDFHFLAEFINRNEKILMINSRLVKGKIGNAEIRDSYALLPFPLSAYKKDDIDYALLEPEVREKHMDKIREYLRSDCIYLWELINEFFNDYGRHLTAPSAAIKQLMKIEDIKIENNGRYFFSEFQKHYFGGRCECLRPGAYSGEIQYLDINSAYAYAMMHQHPISGEWEFKNYEQPPIIPFGFYTIEAESHGALCFRERGALKFDWSGERRIYHTTGWELQAGIETGRISNIQHIEQKFFAKTQSFEKFINHFWGIRQTFKKNTPQNLFAKLMMNSAYGKFSANPENYETFVLYDPAIAEYIISEGWEIRGEIGPHIVASKPLELDEMRFYNVATGASITGFVRAMLLRAMASVENPIYCDTDSLIFTGKHKLDLSGELGAWKLEGIYNEGYFAGKKLYAVKNKDEIKIASKGSKLGFADIKQIVDGNTVKYEQIAPVFSWFKNPVFLERNIKKTACNSK